MPKRGQKKQIERWLVKNVEGYELDLSERAEVRFGVSRSYINAILRDLTDKGEIEATGSTRSRVYAPATRRVAWEYEIDPDLQEHIVWRETVLTEMDGVGKRAVDLCHAGFGEMFNNAVDHSNGSTIQVIFHRSSQKVGFAVVDDGVGIFRKIQDALGLSSAAEAAFELSKGKFTTDPEKHSGEGIFFTSRMFDQFAILSGRLCFTHTVEDGDWLLENASNRTVGTFVSMEVNPRTRRTTTSVYDRYSSSADDYAFDVTHVPVGVLQFGEEILVSRSQAKRVLARIPAFRRVILSFRGVEEIGQAFADEMFRVFPAEHPEIELSVLEPSKQVERMIRRVTRQSVEPT